MCHRLLRTTKTFLTIGIAFFALGSANTNELPVQVHVDSSQPGQSLEVIIEGFRINGLEQDDRKLETPFSLELPSEMFELTLKLHKGEGDLKAYTLFKKDDVWVHGGLTGIGKIIQFQHGDDQGSVRVRGVN